MEPRQVRTAADARRILQERGLRHVKVGVHDVDGILRGKYLHIDKFSSALESGMGFCDVVLGWDSNDQLYDNVSYTGWHTAYPDATVRILPETCREIATEPGSLLFLCEFTDKAEEICPRGILRRVLARAAAMGFEVRVGFEYEFFVFAETAFSIREKGYRNLKPISPGFFGYSMLRNSVLSDWYRDLLAMCETMDMGIEGLHTETGAGVLEAALRVKDALGAADAAALFKLYTKVLAQKRDWLATFMARWSKDWPGCGGHMHMSLWKDGKPVFFDEAGGHGGGQRELLPSPHPGLLGADRGELGRGESHDLAARHPGLGQVDARGVPHRRSRREPLPGACRRRRLRPVGRREQGRSRRADQGQLLRNRASGRDSVAA
jgi:glutamine synthetase